MHFRLAVTDLFFAHASTLVENRGGGLHDDGVLALRVLEGRVGREEVPRRREAGRDACEHRTGLSTEAKSYRYGKQNYVNPSIQKSQINKFSFQHIHFRYTRPETKLGRRG